MTDSPRPARLPKAARQAAIAHYLVRGYSLPRIAETLGYSTRHISPDLTEMEYRFRQQAQQDLRLAKGLALERLDALLSFLWPQCEQGLLSAIRTANALIACRSRLLGTDAPRQITQTVNARRPADSPAHPSGLTDAEALAIFRQILASVPQA